MSGQPNIAPGTSPGPLITPGRRRENSQAWLLTFTDLIALMITFFVMIFAMSTVKTSDWQSLSDSLRERLNTVFEPRPAVPSLRLDMPDSEVTPGADLDYVAQVLTAQLRESEALADSVVRREKDRVFLSMPADMLFASGAYALSEPAARAVFNLGGVLRNFSNRIAVAGHADPRQPRRRYPSNWELSLLRAQSVAAALRAAGYDGRIIARGYGDAQYDALPATLPPEQRRALARRVDVVISRAARESP